MVIWFFVFIEKKLIINWKGYWYEVCVYVESKMVDESEFELEKCFVNYLVYFNLLVELILVKYYFLVDDEE